MLSLEIRALILVFKELTYSRTRLLKRGLIPLCQLHVHLLKKKKNPLEIFNISWMWK